MLPSGVIKNNNNVGHWPSGDVRTAMIKMDNGRSRGMGTVSFYTPEDARRAVRILASAAADVLS